MDIHNDMEELTLESPIFDPYEFHCTDSDNVNSSDNEEFVMSNKKKRTINEVHRRTKDKLISMDKLKFVFCCSLLCLSSIPEEDLCLARNFYQERSKQERSQWIMDWIITTSGVNHTSRNWIIGAKKVCFKAWRLILGIPESTFYKIQKDVADGKTIIGSSGRQFGSAEPKTLTTLAWLQSFANTYAGFMPDSRQLHLPCCMTKTSVYLTMTSELPVEDHISLSHFLKLWRSQLNHIAIPKRSRFSECNICYKLKNELLSTRDRQVKKKLLEQRDVHLKQQKMEREKYYKHAMKARRQPEKYLSIIMDAMDQAKTMLPHFAMSPKFADNMWKLKTHLLGAIVHGIGVYGFFDVFQYPHGSNLTITCLMNLLFMMKDSLPETLYLQMDNCGRENKNRYLMSFLAMLVEKKIFRKVKLSFLMVGHTHEDIDQVFSRFSTWLNRNDAFTLDTLCNGFEKCYQPIPTAMKTTNVWDYSTWILPHLAPIQGHSKHHVFKFFLKDEKAKMVFKEWTTTKVWRECEGDEEFPIRDIPEEGPTCMPPNMPDLDKVEESMNNGQSYFSKEDNIWWQKFFEEKRDEETMFEEEDHPTFLMEELADYIRRRPNKPTETVSVPQIVVPNDVMPPVILGKKNSKQNRPRSIMSTDEEEFCIGDFVLADIDKYETEWPQLGKIIELNSSTTVLIQWFKGSRTTSWSPCTIPIPGQRGKRQPFIEIIEKKDIWMSGFILTPNNCLSKATRDAVDSYTR